MYGPRPVPVLTSLIVHAAALSLLLYTPPAEHKPLSVYQREIAPRERKLVWYRYTTKLPEISPKQAAKRPAKPLRAQTKNAKQTIVSKSSRPDPAKQMIVAPGPELKQDLQAPNLLALAVTPLPEPPVPPKEFTPPAPPPPPVPEQPILEKGPDIVVANAKNPLSELPKPRVPPKPFVPPPQVARQVETPQLEAGEVRSVPAPLDKNPLAALPRPGGPKPKAFTPPPQTTRRTEVALSAAPALPPQAPAPNALPGLDGHAALPARPQPKLFVPPPARTSQPSEPSLEIPKALASNLNAAVVGLNPANRTPVVPDGSRPATFSAAPEISNKGEIAIGSVDSAKVSMPGLMIQGGDKQPPRMASIAALTRVDPTSDANLLASAHGLSARSAPMAALKTTSQVRVSSAPDPRFDGRLVYTMAIQMPNVTSYSGSWLLWYAERKATDTQPIEMLPPEPLRKVDPVYDLSAVDDKVEGRVQLRAIIHTDGYVYGIEVLKGADPRLDSSAVSAMRKWEFTPARRDGAPVDVDIVIEIPFKLRPVK
jgi:TonB family protein